MMVDVPRRSNQNVRVMAKPRRLTKRPMVASTSVRLYEPDALLLLNAAARLGISQSQAVRDAIVRYAKSVLLEDDRPPEVVAR